MQFAVRDDPVSGQQQFHAAAEGHARRRRDDRDWRLAQPQGQLLQAFHAALQGVEFASLDALQRQRQVVADAEARAVVADDQRPAAPLCYQFQRRMAAVNQRIIDAVLLAVELPQCDAVAHVADASAVIALQQGQARTRSARGSRGRGT